MPPPTFCPECRLIRRLAVRNERTLYTHTCVLCSKRTLSIYSPDKPFVIYCRECWNSDKWDPLTYGREYDFKKPFFLQWRELMEAVPHMSLMQMRGSVNSEYANFTIDIKNVYLSTSVLYSENIYYSHTVDDSKDAYDCLNDKNLEMTYWNIEGARNYRAHFTLRTRDCLESAFLFDCTNCQHCFMSSNIRSKQYVFRNKQLTKEQYQAEMAKIDMGSARQLDELYKEFKAMTARAIHKYANVLKTVGSTGDNLENCKNVQQAFDAYDCENLRYTVRTVGAKDVYDVYGSKMELGYECVAAGLDSYNGRVTMFGDQVKDSSYADWCTGVSNLFGCVAIKKKQYCILNKQYTKEEYEELLPKILQHMKTMPYVDRAGRSYFYGDFIPIQLSPFCYNETIAQEYYPLSKEEALTKGYNWHDPEPYSHKASKQTGDLPDNIKETTDEVLKEAIGCPKCGHAYKIASQELVFLRQQNIALPRACPTCRYKERFAMRNPFKLWTRQCMCCAAKHAHGEGRCPNTFETSYSPDRTELVYCEQCYQQEVI